MPVHDVDLRGLARDADGLAQLAKLEREADRQVLVGEQLDAGAPDASESGERRPDFIDRRPEGREVVEPVRAGDRVARQAGRFLDSGDGDARHHTAAAVGDDAVDLALLRPCWSGEYNGEEQCETDISHHGSP